jgi:hypothetical protein
MLRLGMASRGTGPPVAGIAAPMDMVPSLPAVHADRVMKLIIDDHDAISGPTLRSISGADCLREY